MRYDLIIGKIIREIDLIQRIKITDLTMNRKIHIGGIGFNILTTDDM